MISRLTAYQQVFSLVILLVTGSVFAVSAEPSLQQLKIMAENDVVGAYREVQRLRAGLTGGATATRQIALLNLQARLEFLLASTEHAASHSQQALALAEQQHDPEGQAEALLNLAKIALNQGKLRLSTELTFRSATVLSDTTNFALSGELMFWQVLAYRRMGKEQESVRTALQALELAQKNQDLFALAYAYRGLALSYEQSHDLAEAYHYSEQMRYYAGQLPSKLFEAYSLQGLASRAGEQQDAEQAEQLMRQAIALYRELQLPFLVNIGQLSLARMLESQQRHAERITLLNDVLSTYQQFPNPLGQWYALMARSDAYQQRTELTAASQDAGAALQLAQAIGDWSLHQQSLSRQAAIAAARQDYASAYQLTVASAQVEQQAKLQGSHTNTLDAVASYEQEQQQRQIERLNQQSAAQVTLIRQKQLEQRWLYTLLISSLLLSGATLLFMLRLKRANTQLRRVTARLGRANTQLRKLAARLRRANSQLRGLAARLEQIREEERKRIARDLHDEMGQYLTTLRLEISGMRMLCQAKDAAIVARTHALTALVDQTIAVMRDIAASLRPAPLDMGGVLALEWLAEEFSKRSGVACQLDIDSAMLPLDEQYMTVLFRIVQEALTNISRHATASKVLIAMTIQQQQLQLQISDNGSGFHVSKVNSQSYGLAGMRERAIMLGGQLQIQSSIDNGTTVIFTVRLPKEQQADD